MNKRTFCFFSYIQTCSQNATNFKHWTLTTKNIYRIIASVYISIENVDITLFSKSLNLTPEVCLLALFYLSSRAKLIVFQT